jgi:CRP-like cAMP-binding protein
MLSDEEERRIRNLAATADRGTLLRWVGELLEDRKERSALLQQLARQLTHVRRRLRQASSYLDGLLQRAEGTSREPWPGKLPCPHCGAPAVLVRAELRREGHVVVHDHPDGVHCEPPPAKGRRGP